MVLLLWLILFLSDIPVDDGFVVDDNVLLTFAVDRFVAIDNILL